LVMLYNSSGLQMDSFSNLAIHMKTVTAHHRKG
jgi:hypothetical protein